MKLLGMILLLALVQQQPASIEGFVVKQGTGEPVSGVTVQLNRGPRGARLPGVEGAPRPAPDRDTIEDFHRNTKTDSRGRFVFENVTADIYQLIATHESGGYVPAEFGQRSPTGTGIDFSIAAGQKLTGIQLTMTPTGSISGRIYDGDGEPVGKAQVQALRLIYKNGRRTLTIVQIVESDDRGEYRLFWLPPGAYYISAKPGGADGPGKSSPISTIRVTNPARFGTYEQATEPTINRRRLRTGEVVEEIHLPVFYPGVVDVQSAAPIAVPVGSTVGGVDISIAGGRTRSRHVQGRIINAATGQPVADAFVTAIPRVLQPSVFVSSAQSDSSGLFDLAGLLAGSYVVAAREKALSGMITVDVGETDVINVPVVVTAGFKISGRFLVDGRGRTGSEVQVSSLRISGLVRDPELIGMPSAGPGFTPPPNPDGTFTVDGVPTGDFRVTIRGVPPDGYVKSIRMGNDDVLNDGLHIQGPPQGVLEVVISANGGQIDGSVVNAQQQPLANRTVVLVPDVRLRQREDIYKTAATDVAGRFQFKGVAPGGYKLFAWEDVESGAWRNPEFMQVYESRGSTVQVNEGDTLSVQLTVIP